MTTNQLRRCERNFADVVAARQLRRVAERIKVKLAGDPETQRVGRSSGDCVNVRVDQSGQQRAPGSIDERDSCNPINVRTYLPDCSIDDQDVAATDNPPAVKYLRAYD